MSNPQKSKLLSVKKGIRNFKERLSFGSRSLSTTPLRDNVDDTRPQRTEAIGATAPDETLASAHTSSRGTGDSPNNQPPAVPRPGKVQENSAMMSTWLGIQMLLKKSEKVLEGTPLRTPVNAVNVLFDLGNELFSQIKRRLEAVNSSLLELGEEETKLRVQIEGFAKSLIERITELKAMLGRSTWKAILESDEDKTKIENILKMVDKDTTTFVVTAQTE
ncbi:hypothetical protein C0993_011230 [Termitomyces sp. T159_Od127]|nr:hypothetical protein C0993_011230 [Termitomyces sp. T159_Od127]